MNGATDPQICTLRAYIFPLILLAFFGIGSCALVSAASRSNKAGPLSKVAPELTALYDEYSSYFASDKSGPFKPNSSSAQVIEDRVLIDTVASGDPIILKADLESLGMQHAVAYGRVVSGQLPIAAIPRLATLPSLKFARAASMALRGRSF